MKNESHNVFSMLLNILHYMCCQVNSFIVNQLHKSHGDDQEDDEWRLDGQVLLR